MGEKLKHKEHKEPKKHNGFHHGYQEWYTEDNNLWFRGLVLNRLLFGYCECRRTIVNNYDGEDETLFVIR